MKGKDLDLLHELAPVDGSYSTVKGGRLLKHHFYFLAFKPTNYFAIWQETDKQTRHVIYLLDEETQHSFSYTYNQSLMLALFWSSSLFWEHLILWPSISLAVCLGLACSVFLLLRMWSRQGCCWQLRVPQAGCSVNSVINIHTHALYAILAGSCSVVLDVKKSQIKDKCQFAVESFKASWQKQTCGSKPHGWKWATNGTEADSCF